MRVLFDTNVIIDVLQNREPWSLDGIMLFHAVADRRIIGCITAKQIADIHFISKKQFSETDNADSKCRSIITGLLSLFELLDTLAADCQNAVFYENNDYEDAIMITTAVRCKVDCIVTRDGRRFKSAPQDILTPGELLERLGDCHD